jgi:hypothetical protein
LERHFLFPSRFSSPAAAAAECKSNLRPSPPPRTPTKNSPLASPKPATTMAGVPVPPPAGVGAPAVAVPVVQQVCIPGLPPGAASLALVKTKIGPVYVPMEADGTPMFHLLTKQQQNAVKAELGDLLAKASAGGM